MACATDMGSLGTALAFGIGFYLQLGLDAVFAVAGTLTTDEDPRCCHLHKFLDTENFLCWWTC